MNELFEGLGFHQPTKKLLLLIRIRPERIKTGFDSLPDPFPNLFVLNMHELYPDGSGVDRIQGANQVTQLERLTILKVTGGSHSRTGNVGQAERFESQSRLNRICIIQRVQLRLGVAQYPIISDQRVNSILQINVGRRGIRCSSRLMSITSRRIPAFKSLEERRPRRVS